MITKEMREAAAAPDSTNEYRRWAMKLKLFTVTEDHIKLLRRAYVRFDDECEYGAPAIDQKRPYGNSDVEDDIREVLGNPYLTSDECRAIHEETATALQIMLRAGELACGDYESDPYRENWRAV